MPQVSIIVPIYNTEKYLRRCVDSIINQTCKNLQIILVDDGSTDNSGAICDEYARKDDRIKVVHKENGGASSARNRGLDIASGRWVVFIDADDHVTEKYIEQLIVYGESELVITNYHLNIGDSPLEYQEEKIEDYLQTISHSLIANTPWGKLYDSKIIKTHSIRFDESTRFGEDSLFNLSYLLYCNSIRIIPVCGYCYESDGISSERYKLSVQEISRTINKLIRSYELLGHKYDCRFDIVSDIALHISIYPIEKILTIGDDEYFKLYRSFFPDKSKEDLYRDQKCSPMIKVITLAKRLYEDGEYEAGRSLIIDAWELYGHKFKTIEYPYPTHRVIGLLLGAGLLKLVHVALRLYACSKK